MLRKTYLLIGLFVLALVLVACNNEPEGEDSGDDKGSDAAQPEQTEQDDDDDGDTDDSVDGEEVYSESCASCHGDDLEGENGPALDTIGDDMSKDDILDQIEEGGDGMPAEIVEGDEADAVANWLADKD